MIIVKDSVLFTNKWAISLLPIKTGAADNKIFHEFLFIPVHSSGKCNRSIIEHFKGCFEVQRFTWSEIQL